MKKIVLLSCVSKKKNYTTTAENLYESTLFKYSLEYAKMMNADKVYILSALYGLLELNQEIEPYDKTLNKMKEKEKREWSEKVLNQMFQKGLDFEKDKFIFLAGNNYRKHLLKKIKNYEIPMKGLAIGKQLSYLKRSVESE